MNADELSLFSCSSAFICVHLRLILLFFLETGGFAHRLDDSSNRTEGVTHDSVRIIVPDRRSATMNLPSYLDEEGVRYRPSRHSEAYTSQELAQAEHVSGKCVVKPVIVK